MTETNTTLNGDTLALETLGLEVKRGERSVLRGLNLKISRGRWCAIVGPNGAGKSTLLQALVGILPYAGKVTLFGQPLQYQSRQLRARRIAWLAQSAVQSADDLTAYDVVMLGRIPYQSWLGGQSLADHAAAERALKLTHAWEWRDRPLNTLSGGEKQRVLLARLLAVEAEIFLMDEPLANLDPPHQVDWLVLVRQLIARGKTVVSVLHDLTFALYADDLIVMSDGNIQYAGQRDDPALHREIENVFERRIAIQALGTHWVALPTLT
ncbi:MAG: ABC transporter ATP-binding protein [Candidatus Methylopumilus sp.]|nr:ABC transporter ATP-binding protein [Candidatus Methylopumilus sp.]